MDNIQIVCAWCKKVMKSTDVTAPEPIRISHAICPTCYDENTKNINAVQPGVDHSTDLGGEG